MAAKNDCGKYSSISVEVQAYIFAKRVHSLRLNSGRAWCIFVTLSSLVPWYKSSQNF